MNSLNIIDIQEKVKHSIINLDGSLNADKVAHVISGIQIYLQECNDRIKKLEKQRG